MKGTPVFIGAYAALGVAMYLGVPWPRWLVIVAGGATGGALWTLGKRRYTAYRDAVAHRVALEGGGD